MNAPRNFRLNSLNSVLMPPAITRGTAIVAGEACTELGCDDARASRVSWLTRWFGFRGVTRRAQQKET
jgi:hypothetical protein